MTLPVRRRTTTRSPRTKLGDALVQNLVKDFIDHGAGAIAKMRDDKPLEYVKLVLSLLPKDLVEDESAASSYQVVERRVVRPESVEG